VGTLNLKSEGNIWEFKPGADNDDLCRWALRYLCCRFSSRRQRCTHCQYKLICTSSQELRAQIGICAGREFLVDTQPASTKLIWPPTETVSVLVVTSGSNISMWFMLLFVVCLIVFLVSSFFLFWIQPTCD
jgi:hypothetical protein